MEKLMKPNQGTAIVRKLSIESIESKESEKKVELKTTKRVKSSEKYVSFFE